MKTLDLPATERTVVYRKPAMRIEVPDDAVIVNGMMRIGANIWLDVRMLAEDRMHGVRDVTYPEGPR
jgi:hypothetical protein